MGTEILVIVWDARVALFTASRAVQLVPPVVMGGKNSRSSVWNTNWQKNWKIIGASLVASVMFGLTLVASLGAVGACGLTLGGEVWRGPFLQKSSEVHPDIQDWMLLFKLHAWDLVHFLPGCCVKHWLTARCLDPVPNNHSYNHQHWNFQYWNHCNNVQKWQVILHGVCEDVIFYTSPPGCSYIWLLILIGILFSSCR